MADETGTSPPTPAAAGAGNAQGAQETRPQLGIQTQYVKDLSFENPSALERPPEAERSPQITVNVQVEARRLNEQTFEVVLQITAQASHEEKPVFLVELSYAGVFNFIGIPDNAMEPALLIECPRLLFPFARRIVADVTRDGGFPGRCLLAPIDFLALYRNRQQQAAQASEAVLAPRPGRPKPSRPSSIRLRSCLRSTAAVGEISPRLSPRLQLPYRVMAGLVPAIHVSKSHPGWGGYRRWVRAISDGWFRWVPGSSPGMTMCWWGTVGKTTDRTGHWGMNFGNGRR